MNIENIKNNIQNNIRKGSFVKLKWQKVLTNYKTTPADIQVIKISQAVVRFGVQYDNLSKVQEKRENGTLPQENQGLNGMEWILYPYILKNKNNNEFLRVYTVPNCKIESKYYLNGNEITKEEAQEYCTKANFSSNNTPLDCFNVKIENILELSEKTA